MLSPERSRVMFAPFFAFSTQTPMKELCQLLLGSWDNGQTAEYEQDRSQSKLLQASSLACQLQAFAARFREWHGRVKYPDTLSEDEA